MHSASESSCFRLWFCLFPRFSQHPWQHCGLLVWSLCVCVCSWQWQLEWYGLYTVLTCIIGHTECSVQCQCQCCHSDKAVVSCWRLTDLALHQQGLTLCENYSEVLATYKCLYSTHAWVRPMFDAYPSHRESSSGTLCFGLWLLNMICQESFFHIAECPLSLTSRYWAIAAC